MFTYHELVGLRVFIVPSLIYFCIKPKSNTIVLKALQAPWKHGLYKEALSWRVEIWVSFVFEDK